VLKIERVGRQDDFFKLGGHSLLAVSVMARLVAMGWRMTLADLYRAPTVEALARCAQQNQTGVAWEPRVVRVREPQPGESPLFLMHENMGNDAYFAVLGSLMDERLGVYGITAVPLNQPPFLDSMEAQAQRIADIIARAQPQGPVRVAGWSYGGTLAYAVAVALLARGRQVEYLGLIDSLAKDTIRNAPTLCQVLLNFAEHFIQTVIQADLEDPRYVQLWEQMVELTAQDDFEALWSLANGLEGFSSVLPHGRDGRSDRAFLERLQAHDTALAAYLPPAISRPMHLYIASDEPQYVSAALAPAEDPGPNLGWDQVLPLAQITVHWVPGNHRTMIYDSAHARELAGILSVHLLQLTRS